MTTAKLTNSKELATEIMDSLDAIRRDGGTREDEFAKVEWHVRRIVRMTHNTILDQRKAT